MSDFVNIPAGEFSVWLQDFRRSLRLNDEVNVQCGECNACCSSSYFIHIRPDESRALSHIPKQLLFQAPGYPKGTLLLGYGKDGSCPMLVENRCTIYTFRPMTCRNYDCRIFAATGIAVRGKQENLIAQRVLQWKFDFPGKQDKEDFAAVQAAARFIQENAPCFPPDVLSRHPSQSAILAIQVYDVFLNGNDNSGSDLSDEERREIAGKIIAAKDEFERCT